MQTIIPVHRVKKNTASSKIIVTFTRILNFLYIWTYSPPNYYQHNFYATYHHVNLRLCYSPPSIGSLCFSISRLSQVYPSGQWREERIQQKITSWQEGISAGSLSAHQYLLRTSDRNTWLDSQDPEPPTVLRLRITNCMRGACWYWVG